MGVVFDLIGVAVAVDFNDKAEFGTIEDDDIGTDRLLAQEFVFAELLAAQDYLPKQGFSGCGVATAFASEGGQAIVVGKEFKPLPGPSNRKRRWRDLPLVRGGC